MDTVVTSISGSDSHRQIIAGMVVTKVLFPLKTALRGQGDIDSSTASHVYSKPVFNVFFFTNAPNVQTCGSAVPDYYYLFKKKKNWGGAQNLLFADSVDLPCLLYERCSHKAV